MSSFARRLLLAGCALACCSACDTRPDYPRTKWYGKPIETVEVAADDSQEVNAVLAVERARNRYRTALETLQDYYIRIGDVQKSQWARRELNNLAQTRRFQWVGIPAMSQPTTQPAGPEVSERALVESVLARRQGYLNATDALARLFEDREDAFKAYVVHTMQARFHSEETFRYLRSAEMPPPQIEPAENIPAANRLYDEAEALYEKGVKSPPWFDYSEQRRALELFQEFVRTYPRSTRVAMAAYCIGDLYRRYFDEPYLAALWLQRAWTWDPYVPRPARFQAARLYDFALGDRKRALELYRQSLTLEPFYKDNTLYARQRIKELERIVRYQD